MRLVGLDLGTKTLGVSATDKTNTLVSPYRLIKFVNEDYEDALEKLMVILKELNTNKVILGLPKNMDGSLGFAADRSFNFKKMLEGKNIEVVLEDERLTTVEALNIMKSNGLRNLKSQEKVDSLSAVLILENYLKRAK